MACRLEDLIHPFTHWFFLFLLNNLFIFTGHTFHGVPQTYIQYLYVFLLWFTISLYHKNATSLKVNSTWLPLHRVELFFQPPADPLRIQNIPSFCNQITVDQVLSEMGIGECLALPASMCPNRAPRPLSTTGISTHYRMLVPQHFSRVNNHPDLYPVPSSVGEECLLIVWTRALRIKPCFMSCSQANTYASETHSTTLLATMNGFNLPTI